MNFQCKVVFFKLLNKTLKIKSVNLELFQIGFFLILQKK